MLPPDGIGDLGASTSQVAPTPYRSDQDHNRFQTVYTRDNLIFGGAPASGSVQILSVGFNIAQVINAPFYNSGTGLVNYTIKMRNIPLNITGVGNSFLPIDDSHIVKQPFNLNSSVINTTGFHDFMLDSPFVWDGVGNILIDVCYGINGGIASANNTRGTVLLHSWNNFTQSNISRREFASNSINICNGTGNNVQQANHKPVARFGFVPEQVAPLCPISVSPSSITICQGEQVNLSVSGATNYVWSNPEVLSCNQCNNPVANPSQSITLQVIGSVGDCSDTAFVQIQVNSPADFIIEQTPAGVNTLCQGPVTLSAPSGFTNVQWSNGSQGAQMLVTEPGTYSATSNDANGCSVSSQSITFNEVPLPEVNIQALSPPYLCSGSVILQANSGFQNYTWSNGATGMSVEIIAPGVYSATAQNAAGCSGQSNAIEVFPAYTLDVQISTPSNFICENQSITLNANQSYAAYQWSTGALSQSITITSSGNYSLTAFDVLGCSGVSNTISIEQIASPNASFSYNQNEGYVIEFNNTSNNAESYLWIFHDGSTSAEQHPIFEYPFDNFYPITLIVSNGCGSDTLNAMVEVKKLSIEHIALSPIIIYPNPAADYIVLDIPFQKQLIIDIFDLSGRLIERISRNQSESHLPLQFQVAHLSPGLYLISIATLNGQYISRFIKQ
jgi:hypothetical protein